MSRSHRRSLTSGLESWPNASSRLDSFVGIHYHDFSFNNDELRHMSTVPKCFEEFDSKPKGNAKVEEGTLQNHFQANAMKGLTILFEDPKETFADCKIISCDGQEFHAHKNILIVRSPVFLSMLKSGMKEAQTGVIEMKDHSSKVIKFLLRFLYTCEVLPFSVGVVKELPDLPQGGTEKPGVLELVDIATKYQVEDLVKYFDANLGGLCKEENASFLLKLVNKYPLPKAQEKIWDFILDRPQLNRNILSQY